MNLTGALLGPIFGMRCGLIQQKWFAKLQADCLGEILPGLRHGDLSINNPELYAQVLTEWIRRESHDNE